MLLYPTHFSKDPGWSSDTEPPKEELDKIRQRYKQQQEQKVGKQVSVEQEKEVTARQKKMREQATQRQIENMRSRLKPKQEL